MMEVAEVYENFKSEFPPEIRDRMKPAWGGFPDLKGPNTSDVDISFLCESLDEGDKYFSDICSKKKDDERTHIIYTFYRNNREINIYCTPFPEIAQRAIIHRRNHLMLNEYYLLAAQAMALKKYANKSTTEAWIAVLELEEEGNPYEIMSWDTSRLKVHASRINERVKNMLVKYNEKILPV